MLKFVVPNPRKITDSRELPTASALSSISSTADLIAYKVDQRHSCLRFGTLARFLMLALVLLCLASIWSNILVFNYTLICIIPTNKAPIFSANSARATSKIHLPASGILYNPAQKIWLTLIVAIGAIIGYLPITVLIGRYEIRVVFIVLGLLSITATAIIPTAITASNYGALIFLRFLQGIAIAGNFPVIGFFNSRWAPYKQNGLFVSVLIAFVQFAPALTNLITGPLCTYVSWQSVFYVHAAHSAVVFILFGVFFRNSPGQNQVVGGVESSTISRRKSTIVENPSSYSIVPLSVLKSLPVWASWIVSFGIFSVQRVSFLYVAIYANRVLQLSTIAWGITAALLAIAQFLVIIASGTLSDQLCCISDVKKMRCFNSLSSYGASGLFVALAYFDIAVWPRLSLTILMAAIVVLGGSAAGFAKSAHLIAGRFGYIITGAFSPISSAAMLIVSVLIGDIATDGVVGVQWRCVWLVCAATLVTTNTFFCIFCSATPCYWTTKSTNRGTKTRRQTDACAK